MKYCDVLIEESFLNNQALTYATFDDAISFGKRVKVKVRGRDMIGFVTKVYEPIEMKFKVAMIESIIDEEAVINSELYDIAKWMSMNTFTPLIRCLQTILPNKLVPRSTSQSIKMIKYIKKIKGEFDLTTTQTKFINSFDDMITYTEARKRYSGVKKLIEKNAVEMIELESQYAVQSIKQSSFDLELTKDQEKALNAIESNKTNTYLLHGVTGSGKTEVYLQKAKEVLNSGRQVLIMVPEIALTPQMIERVSSRFAQDIAIFHSRLNEQEKYEQYKRLKNKEISVVVGTRSSVFMPFDNLGLIVIDEEHDHSYKQSVSPYYHALDIALQRSKTHNCPLVLGSASPSLESYARAVKGNYQLLELNDRINHSFPKVTLIDTREALMSGESQYLTPQLIEAISLRLEAKQQIILLLNRRGYHTLLKNAKTDEILMCPHCDVSLTYHKRVQEVRCHICGYGTKQLPKIDGEYPKIVGMGVGTQRLCEILESKFPEAKISRMDADTTQKKGSHQKILESFINHESDILVGTQMIAKGLDIENVTLVGVINADASLSHMDYRAVETTFSLLLQAAGRSGRGAQLGEVMIQTENPNHYAITYASKHEYRPFFMQEMNYRKTASYPPYSYLISLIFRDLDESKAFSAADSFLEILDSNGFQVIGPTMLRKMNRMHHVRIIFKGKDLECMKQRLRDTLVLYQNISRIGVVVDVNPLTLE